MRWASLVLGSLLLAATLPPLLGQAPKPQASSADSYKAQQFELAWASGFDFNKVPSLNRRSLFPQVVWGKMPDNLVARRDSGLCYTLNVYKFSHEDDQVPRITGSTTCTPADRFALKSADIVISPASKAGQAPH